MNIIILNGRLVRDPEVKAYGHEGKTYTRFTVAVDRPVQKGQEKKADFIPCTAFGKAGELVGNYFNKGSRILLDGRLQINSYEKDGKHYSYSEVMVNHVEFVDSKKDGEKRNGQGDQKPDNPMGGFGQTLDEDIPF